MRKVIGKGGVELAVVLGTDDYMQCTDKRFFSDNGDTLQVGSLFFPQGAEVAPHKHKLKEDASAPMEVLIVLCGAPIASIYDEDHSLVETVELRVGDILIQKHGGHGFKFAHKSALLEIKRGPYHGKDSDKEAI